MGPGDLPAPPPIPEPIVRPRTPPSSVLPLVVAHVQSDFAYVESEDREMRLTDWVETLEDAPPALVACQGAGRLLELCHARWWDHPRWQFKATPAEETTPDGEASITRTIISFFGFSGKVKGLAHRANRYFYCLDPLQFARMNLRELSATGEAPIITIWRWAAEVRDFCVEHDLKPTTTRGSLAKQLLRDPRFYPAPRRKIPKATNDRAREHLPGNHYELLADRDRLYSGLYLDQEAAHHTIAGDIPLPADDLRAHGHFHSVTDIPWAWPGTRRYAKVISEHGLLLAKVNVQPGRQTVLAPPWTARAGKHLVYLWTNELRILPLLRVDVEYIVAAWTSPNVDQGLRRYARWAKGYVRNRDPLSRQWIKPTLLTVYGMLATRPRKPVAGWWQAKGGTPTLLPIGSGLLAVKLKEAQREGEPSTNHVIQRGMIEAEMRARSLELAQALREDGHDILCVYADAVMVRPVGPLPLIPDYWRPKGALNLLRFLDETHFVSREMVRLPGVRRDSPLRHRQTHSQRAKIRRDEQPTLRRVTDGHVRP